MESVHLRSRRKQKCSRDVYAHIRRFDDFSGQNEATFPSVHVCFREVQMSL